MHDAAHGVGQVLPGGAAVEGVDQSLGAEADHERAAMSTVDVGVLRDQRPAGAADLLELVQDRGPVPPHLVRIEAASRWGGLLALRCSRRARLLRRGGRGVGRSLGLRRTILSLLALGRGILRRLRDGSLLGRSRRSPSSRGRGLLRGRSGIDRLRGGRGRLFLGRAGPLARLRRGLRSAATGLSCRFDLLLRDATGLFAGTGSTGGALVRSCLLSDGPRGRSALGRGTGLTGGERGPLVAQHQASCEQLEVEPRRGRAAHRGEGLVDEVAAQRQIGRREERGLAPHPLELIGGDLRQQVGSLVRHGGQHDQVAHPLQQVLDEAAGLMAGGQHVLDRAVQSGGITLGDGGDRAVQQGGVGEAEQCDRGGEVEPAFVGPRHQLVQHRHRVTGGAGTGAHHQRHHALADLHLLGDADLLEVGAQHLRRDQPERVVVGA